ncbi:hypothetical protein Tco_0610544 [Tanacetum coccineum]
MSYPRFTKIIVDYFMSKDQSNLRRNKMFWHNARDDTMFTSMRCISRHEDTQVYGTILPKELTNQAILDSNAYKTYYAFAFREKTPKPKIKSKAKVVKYDKKKQPAKKAKAKGLAVLSEGVPDVPMYEPESEKESRGDIEDEDDENNFDDISDEGDNDNDGNNGNDGDDDNANDDDKQEGDDTNDDDEETDSDRTESDRIKIPILDQSTTEYYEE